MTPTEAIRKTRYIGSAMTERISPWGRLLWRALSFSPADDRIAPKRCLSVLLESGGVSVAYASRLLSRIQIRGIRRYPSEEGKYPAPEAVASSIALALNDFKAPRADVTLIVPKAWVIMKTADLPITVKGHLSGAVSYELDRLTPLSPERAFYDYLIMAEDETRIQIILAAMKAEMLQPYLEALKEKGVVAGRVTVSLSAYGTFSHHVHRRGITAFVDMHTGGYEGGLIRDGKWEASFAGAFMSDDDESRFRRIASEINPLLDGVKEKGGAPIVFVNYPPSWTGWAALPAWIHAPVRLIRETDPQLRFLEKAKTEGLPYTALGGVLESLRPASEGINLLDRGLHPKPKTPMALTAVLLIILAGLGIFWLVSPLQIEQQKIEAIDRAIAARKERVKKIEVLKKDLGEVEKEISTINTFKSSPPMMQNLLKELTQVLPKNAWLSRVRFTESNVEIEGYATAATELLPKLEAARHFKKVEFASPTFRDARMNMDRFTIKMDIEGLPEAKARNEKKE